MKINEVINEHNLSAEEIDKLPIHKKVRGVVFVDENTIICVEENSHNIDNLLGLPGGTVEDNEDEILAFNREVKEETGYEVEDIIYIGVIKVIKKNYVSYTSYYKAKTKGAKKGIKLTSEEIEVGTHPVEINFNNAINRINEEYNKTPNDNSLRSMSILKEIKV
jgi:ADP-ribose pyrophosphatase YjhB (NUDIX family)